MNEPARKIAFVTAGFLLLGGCEQENRAVRPPAAVVQRVETIHAALTQQGSHYKHLAEFEATDRLFDGIEDSEERKAAAEAFGRMILSVDLQSLLLPFRETATSKYALYVCQCFKIMGRCGIPTREAMEFFFQGLANYRDSCEDPSLAMPPREGENPEDVRVRQSSARILKEDYAARMSIFEHVWLPNLSRYLPPELHDEFRQRLKAFSSSPSLPEERPDARNATDENRIEILLDSQTNNVDTVRAIRCCSSEMPGLLDRLSTDEDRAKWIGRWEESLWQLADGARSYREKMSIVCAVEEAVFAVKAAREKSAPNPVCGWAVVVRWLDWYASQVAQAESAAEGIGLAEREEEHLRQGIVYTRRHFQRGLLSMFRKKYLYAMRNRWFPELDKTLSPEQAAQVKAQLTAAAERIASRHHD